MEIFANDPLVQIVGVAEIESMRLVSASPNASRFP